LTSLRPLRLRAGNVLIPRQAGKFGYRLKYHPPAPPSTASASPIRSPFVARFLCVPPAVKDDGFADIFFASQPLPFGRSVMPRSKTTARRGKTAAHSAAALSKVSSRSKKTTAKPTSFFIIILNLFNI